MFDLQNISFKWGGPVTYVEQKQFFVTFKFAEIIFRISDFQDTKLYFMVHILGIFAHHGI